MTFKQEVEEEIIEIFQSKWETNESEVVPEAEDVLLGGNHGLLLEGTVLYADLVESTKLVKNKSQQFAAEVYKAFLIAACKVIRKNGGEITAFDGDRVMAVYLGGRKNTNAAITALQINYAVKKILNPRMKMQYPETDYEVKHAVGIDTGNLLVARTGIRGSNDLVWVDRSANYAAKLCAIRHGYCSYITDAVFKRLSDEAKYGSKSRELMWKSGTWTEMNIGVHFSNWTWQI